jgi:hypothetical protein
MELLFTTNSPGEVATWLAPTLRAVKRLAPAAKTTVFLVPCAFATGAEAAVVRAMPEADRVFTPQDYWRIVTGVRRFQWLGGRRPAQAALLYLGGDLVHAAVLARRLRVRRWRTWSGAAAGRAGSTRCWCRTNGRAAASCAGGSKTSALNWWAT